MFLNTVTVKTKILPLFIPQIPRVNLAEVGSNTARDVKQRILLVDLGECFGYNHQMAPVEHNHQMAPVEHNHQMAPVVLPPQIWRPSLLFLARTVHF